MKVSTIKTLKELKDIHNSNKDNNISEIFKSNISYSFREYCKTGRTTLNFYQVFL